MKEKPAQPIHVPPSSLFSGITFAPLLVSSIVPPPLSHTEEILPSHSFFPLSFPFSLGRGSLDGLGKIQFSATLLRFLVSASPTLVSGSKCNKALCME